jgi:alpha-galactosidase/6-phospho-beta-glucosidase family protein
LKIVLIGGGSFVFAPTVLEDAILKYELSECELVLVDPNMEVAEAMAGAGRRIAAATGVNILITAAPDRKAVLSGADFVIVSASPQGAARWKVDYELLKTVGMADQARECGGMGGMLNSFRSITMIMDICEDMERFCPNATLLDVTNPMPRVVTAVHKFTSIRSYGFCNIAYRGAKGYDFLPLIIGREPNDLQITTAGLNHFAWVVEMRDKHTGQDLLPLLERNIREGDWSLQPFHLRRELFIMRRWLEQYGGIAAGSVDHHAEYLPLQQDIEYASTPPYHGTDEQRRKRLQELKAIAEGRLGGELLFNNPSWEHPIEVAVALQDRSPLRIDILNMSNRGYIPQLPDGRIVEVPAAVEDGKVFGIRVPPLPKDVAELCGVISDVHEMVAEAAVKGDLALVRQVIEKDPAISDKHTALSVVEEMIRAHEDLIPQFR